MSATVARVKVTDDGPTRRTTITVLEGRHVVNAEASTLPSPVRAALLGWLDAGQTKVEPWRGEHGGGAILEQSDDAPAVEASIGFVAPACSPASAHTGKDAGTQAAHGG